ncbi:MAG: fibronectin type III domain-containing protein, partial [Propionibacteriaceae bacterium]|nr:fibronectin type III domain-containing protein [Propionibacteriaceae bacterium]
IGPGAWSNVATATPSGDKAKTPGAPTGLAATAGDTMVGLSWVAPADDGDSAIVDYAVSYRVADQATWTVVRTGTTLTAYTVTGLANGTAYDFKVAAVNAIGVGPDSSLVRETPDASKGRTPGAPTGLTAGAGDTVVGLRWTTPADDGGSAVTKYAVAWRPAGTAFWQTQVTAGAEPWAVVGGLANGASYEFKVAAFNAIGVGPWSASQSATPTAGAGKAPGAPADLTATPGNTEVGLKWTAPDGNGSPVTSYVMAYKPSASSAWTLVDAPADLTMATVRDLVNGTSYDFKVAAVNAVAVGPWSAVKSATPSADLAKTPAAPTGLTATPGDSVVGLAWTAPADNGSAIVSYVVFYRAVGDPLWRSIVTDSQAVVATVTGLVNGTVYEFKVAAVNGIGLGFESSPVQAKPAAGLGTVPSAPRDVAAEAGNAYLTVTWSAPATGGDLRSYLVEYRPQGSASWAVATTAGDVHRVRLSGLVNGQPYEVRVTAVNQIGPGTPSAPVVATPTYGPMVEASPDSLKPGETLTIKGSGFTPGETVVGEIHSDNVGLGTQTVDADGNVTFTWTVPADFALGAHDAVVIDTQGTLFKARFTVLAAEIEPTGADVAQNMATAAGLSLLLAVACLLAAWRRSDRRPATAGRRAAG